MRIQWDCRAKIKSMNDDRQIHHRPLAVLAISVILLVSAAIALTTGLACNPRKPSGSHLGSQQARLYRMCDSREAWRNFVDDPRPYLRHCGGWVAEAAKMGLVSFRRVICRQCRRRRGADFYWRTGERRIRSSNCRWICDLSNQIASQRVFRYPVRSRLN